MSMRNYVVDDYGLVLDINSLRILASKILYEGDGFYAPTVVAEELGIEYISDFTGRASAIKDNGEDDWESRELFSEDIIFYLRVRNRPTLFSQVYESVNELISEFKEELGEFLPEDFDYRGNTRHIVGTFFG